MARAQEALRSGKALEKFCEMIAQQGGPDRLTDHRHLLPKARYQMPVKSHHQGYVVKVDARQVGLAACALGCGRTRVEDTVDPAVGLVFEKKVGNQVAVGETLLTIYYNDEKHLASAQGYLENAIEVDLRIKAGNFPLIKGTIGG